MSCKSKHYLTNTEIFFFLSILLLFFQVIFSIENNRFLYADGSFYFLSILGSKWFFLVEPSRLISQIIQQFFPVMALQLGVDRFSVIIFLFGIGTELLPLIFTVACYFFLPRDRKVLFLFPLLSYLAGVQSTSFASISVEGLTSSYFWLSLIVILFAEFKNLINKIVLLLLILPVVLMHECMVFLATLLIIATFFRILNQEKFGDKFTLSFIILWLLITISIQAWFIYYPRDPNNKAGFIRGLISFLWLFNNGLNVPVLLGLLSLALTCTFSLACIFINQVTNRLIFITSFIFAIFSLYVLLDNFNSIAPSTQFMARGFPGFVAFFLATALLVVIGVLANELVLRIAALNAPIIAALLITNSIWHIASTQKWSNYLDSFQMIISKNQGLISWNNAITSLSNQSISNFTNMSWPWTNPSMSILMSNNRLVKSIISNPGYNSWQPFDPAIPSTLPYPDIFDYSQYVSALNTAISTGIDFTKPDYPYFISTVSGVSNHEPWGRWSDGKIVEFQFKQALPTHFILILTAQAFGPNIGAPVTVKIGAVEKNIQLTANPQEYQLTFAIVSPVNRIEFLVPHPISPAEFWQTDDRRKLGIGFFNLKIKNDL